MIIKIGSEDVKADVVGFTAISEPWTECVLDDGYLLRFKSTILRVLRLPGLNEDGTPKYYVQSNALIVVNEREK
jgi:hypothetical protein